MANRFAIRAVTGALLCWYTTASANPPLPPGYPSAFDWSGLVDELELSNNMIIINDRQFVLARGARLHGPKGTAGTSSLHKGMPVGVRVDTDGQTKTILELWLLPDRQPD